MRKVGALIFPGFELLDLFGPLELLGMLEQEFELSLVAQQSGSVRSNQQVSATADTTFAEAEGFDIILVPGGRGTRSEVTNTVLLGWIGQAAASAEYVLSVCTGSALLARAGVLDGKRATTNKAAFDWVVTQGPKVDWVPQARWVEDGHIFTSSGVSAGMDMTLGAIGHILGGDTAEQVADWAEYTWHRDKNADPFAARYGLV